MRSSLRFLLASSLILPSCGKDKAKDEAAESADATAAPEVAPVACLERKSPQAFVTTMTQDLFGRQPTQAELAEAAGDFDAAAFVDAALASSAADDGITRFVSNLLRLGNLKPENDRDAEEAALVADLKQEPVVLVLRNKDKPWRHVFETTDVYCSARTARLYDYPVFNTEGFVSCKLPPERAGLLGLVSTLRSTSLSSNPQAFFRGNNNYHRVAVALYLIRGIQLQAATNGPTGDGPLTPLASCVPATDMRKTKDGLIFGTAAIPLAGSVCSSCHSRFLAPLSVAFRRFGTKGEVLGLEDVDRIPDTETGGIPREHLKAILAEQHSCWAPEDGGVPQAFVGLPGFAKLAAGAPTLGHALAIQVPQHLANVTPDENMLQSIEASYNARGETLLAAFRGFFLSDSYQCARKQ